MNHDVFISYSSKNPQAAQAICHELEEHGIRCWMAPRDIPVGSKYASEITHAIKECKVVVLVFSEYSALSPWVESEINIAFSNRKPIIPYKIDTVTVENYDEFYLMLNNRHWIEAYPDYRSRFSELVTVVSTMVGHSAKPSATPTVTDIPKPAPQPASNPVKTYKVGDYYNENGKEGVVFEVDSSGLHGKIVSMKQSANELQWCTNKEYYKDVATGSDDKTDGMKNLRTIMSIDGWREKYPAFVWCDSLGDGWYLPAIEELKKFTLDDSVHDSVNRTLSQHGGDIVFNEGEVKYYRSSSEFDSKGAWNVDMYFGSMRVNSKYRTRYVRAVSAF